MVRARIALMNLRSTGSAWMTSGRMASMRPMALLGVAARNTRSEEHTSELQSREKLVCRPLRPPPRRPPLPYTTLFRSALGLGEHPLGHGLGDLLVVVQRLDGAGAHRLDELALHRLGLDDQRQDGIHAADGIVGCGGTEH